MQCSPKAGGKLDRKGLKLWIKDTKDAINMRPTGNFSTVPGSEDCPMVRSTFSGDTYDNDLTGFVDFKGLVDFSPRIIPFVQYNYQVLGYNVSISVCAGHLEQAALLHS